MLKTKNTIKALLITIAVSCNQGYATTNHNPVEANIYGAIMAAIENNYTPTNTQIANWDNLFVSIETSMLPSDSIGISEKYSYNSQIDALEDMVGSKNIKNLMYNDTPQKKSSSKNTITGAEAFSSKIVNDSAKQTILSTLADTDHTKSEWLSINTPQKGKNASGPEKNMPLFDPDKIKGIKDDKEKLKQVKNYISQYKSSMYMRAVALSAMNQVLTEKESNSDSAAASINAMINPTTLANSSPLTIAKNQLLVLAQIEKQNRQAHLDSERNAALMSVLILEMNNMATSNNMMQKNQIKKLLKGK